MDVFDDHLLAKLGVFRYTRIDLDKIVEVRAQPLWSLFDEIGIIIAERHEFIIRETQPGFRDVCTKLDLDRHFGDDWYRRVEEGEWLSVSFQ